MMLIWKCWRTASVCVLVCVGSGLCTQVIFMHSQLCSCVRRYVLKALRTWEWICVCGVLFAYMGFDLRTWDAWHKPHFVHFRLFSIVSLPHAILTHLFFIFASDYHYTLFYLHFCIKISYFLNFAWIRDLMSSSFFSFFFFCPHMLIGEAPIRWWSGSTFLSSKPRAISERRALSLSLVFFQRSLRVLPWCSVLRFRK